MGILKQITSEGKQCFGRENNLPKQATTSGFVNSGYITFK